MNLNYNINNALLSKNRNFFLGQVDYEWVRAVSVATGIQSGSIIFGTGSIEYVPFAPSTFFVSGTYAEGRIGSGSALGLPIKTAITGSGVWAVTGSNQFSIVIGGNLGFNQSEILTLSAGAGNMNLSGSKISSSFAPLGNQEYNISFGLTHTKGNIYNPLINWNAVKTSPLGNNVKVNGEVSASFNLVQNTSSGSTDKFTNLAFIKEVSGSAQSSSFNNEFGFSVTASYTASINNVTGSTTMSFVCAEEALNQTLTFFNPNTTTAIGSASFVASNNSVHSLVTSINYNKGNINNGPINFSSINLSPVSNVATLNGYTASFNLVKDKNVSIINYPQVTGSRFGTFNNDYAFNFTSSLTASIQSNATGSVTMSLEIPEAGISTSSILFSATSAGVNTITASFDTRNENPYNITASVIFNKGNISTASINYKVSSSSTTQDLEGNTAQLNGNSSSLNLKKDIAVLVNYNNITASISGTYSNDYSFNQTASLTSSILPNTTGSVTMSLEIPEIGFATSSLFFNPTSAGIKILSASFVAQTDSSSYNITASVINNKGNESNSNINFKVSSSSTTQDLEGNTAELNNNSSSFNLKKDIAVLVNYNNITASINGTYKNNYSFNQTASLTSSILANTTGSVTMSLVIPEIGFSTSSLFFNPTSAGIKILSASFVATTASSSYNITASVINNKGNESNANLNYLATASNMATNGVTSSFQMVKDANVKIVGVDNMLNGVQSTIKNNYAFNVTASLSGSFTSSWANITSQSLRTNKFFFAIPETGFVTESLSSPVNFTASFVATTDSASYNITASCIAYSSSAILVQASVTSGSLMNTNNTITIDADGLDFIANGTSSLNFYTSSINNYGSFILKTLTGSGANVSSSNYNIRNFPNNYFPYPYIPTYDVDAAIALAYWGTPSMAITGSSSTTYYSGSNITVHSLSNGATASYYETITPTTASSLLAETMTVGGGGRGGTKDAWFGLVPSGREYIFSGAGGAGGYILANNYFKKGVAYNIVVGAGSPRWDGTAAGAISPISGSDSYIFGDGTTIQLSKGGGNGGPVTGSGWDGPDVNTQGAGGRAGGSAGGGGYVDGQARTELGAESITGSVNNIFESYGAFEGFDGGTAYSPFRVPNVPNAQANAGGGGGASQNGFDNLAGTNTLGAGGLGKYDLSFTMGGVAGGGNGANSSANSTGSLDFGGGQSQRYTVSGSLIACDGVDGTGGGGGGLISGSLQPGQAPFNYTTKGGSGKVQIRYVSSTPLASGGTIESGSISGSLYILHTFTASGTFTPNL